MIPFSIFTIAGKLNREDAYKSRRTGVDAKTRSHDCSMLVTKPNENLRVGPAHVRYAHLYRGRANNYCAAATGPFASTEGRFAEKPEASDSQVDSPINAALRNVRLTALSNSR